VVRAAGYHDHNWGVWRAVTWEWGVAHGAALDVLYGGVRTADSAAGGAPFFLAAVDSMGIRQVLRFREIRYTGAGPAAAPGVRAPAEFLLSAARETDTLRLRVAVEDALGSVSAAADFRRYFLQMRGRFTLEGWLVGEMVRDSGSGFFETYVKPAAPRTPR
jgi:hypothetical protein